jgi:hypothetical protein
VSDCRTEVYEFHSLSKPDLLEFGIETDHPTSQPD